MIQTRINKGVAFLNEQFPDWHHHINTNNLDIASAHLCVLAQIGRNKFDMSSFDVYYQMVQQLMPVGLDQLGMGFVVDLEESTLSVNASSEEAWDEVTDTYNYCWKRTISAMQQEGK